MTENFDYAIRCVNNADASFCRFITSNDVNLTSHQSGFYVSKESAPVLFDTLGVKGENMERFVTINWNGWKKTESRFIYYGQGTRNEYRITRFGNNFPYMREEAVGSLLILCKMSEDYYEGIVLERDEDIDAFYEIYNLPADKTNNTIYKSNVISPDAKLEQAIQRILEKISDFPESSQMSAYACDLYNSSYGVLKENILLDPDKYLQKWIETEYKLFGKIEEKIYKPVYTEPFSDCQDLINFSNKILNRRKSRAGKSLEHHLANVFNLNKLKFDAQKITEDNKKPDFLFPGAGEYHNLLFPAEDLVFLGAKTTCKDRWRQVLNEADRIDDKFLFTLQGSISKNQLEEMKHNRLTLVVPEENKKSFDPEFRGELYSLKQFIDMVKEKQLKYHYVF